MRIRSTKGDGVDWWEEPHAGTSKAKLMANAPLQCACGGDEKGHCIASHQHHLGNELADSLAEEGKALDPAWMQARLTVGTVVKTLELGRSADLFVECGEERALLITSTGAVTQGPIAKVLETATSDRRIAALSDGASKKGNQWAMGRSLSWAPARKSAMGADTSWRFKVRAWADCLPTYENISKRAKGDGINIYKVVYADGDDFAGECSRCGESGAVESMAHAFCTCVAGEAKRHEVELGIKAKWEEAGLGLVWDEVGWLQPQNQLIDEGWQSWWGWVGLVPKTAVLDAMQQDPQAKEAIQVAVSKTARMMTKQATAEWGRRCESVLAAEKLNGVHDRKVIAGKSKWKLVVEGPQKKRGRPEKDPTELCLAYRRQKESQKKKGELLAAHGAEEGGRLHKVWLQERLKSETPSGGGDIQEMLKEVALKDNLDGWRGHVQQRRARHAKMLEELREKEYAPPTDGACVVEGCEEQGVYVNGRCEEGAARCKGHWGVSCWGGWRGCGCDGERPGKRHPKRHQVQKKKRPSAATQKKELVQRQLEGELLWMRAALEENGQQRAVAGRVTWVIQEPCFARLRTPTERSKWKPASEVYVEIGGEEISIMLDDVEWELLDSEDWEGADLDSPADSESEGEENEPNDRNTEDETEASEEEFNVERILKRRVAGGDMEYYVKWEGWDGSYNNWEPQSHILQEQADAGQGQPSHGSREGVESQPPMAGTRRSARVQAQAAPSNGLSFEEAEEFLEGYTQEGDELSASRGTQGAVGTFEEAERFLEGFTQEGDELQLQGSQVGAGTMEMEGQGQTKWGICEREAPQAPLEAGWWTEGDISVWETEGRRVLEEQDALTEALDEEEADVVRRPWVFDDMG